MMWLTLLMAIPIIGTGVIAILPKKNEQAVKQIALTTTLIVLAMTLAMATRFQRDNVELQFTEKYSWIPSFGIN